MKEDQYYLLISGKLSGESTLEDEKLLKEWLEKSKKNRMIYDEIESIWNRSRENCPEAAPEFEAFWGDLRNRLRNEMCDYSKKWNYIKSTGIKRVAAVAAVLVMVLAIGSFYKDNIIGPSDRCYETGSGVRLGIDLPDGSRVKLNSGSKLSFQKDFTDSARIVYLAGQAFFDVRTDGRPFIVRTNNANTRVLGTKFAVKTENDRSRVIVEEGRVALKSIYGDSAVILTANQLGFCEGSKPPDPPLDVDADSFLGWLTQFLIFERTPLDQVVKEICRNYDVNIVIEDTAVASLTLTGRFKSRRSETIIKSICLTLDIDYRFEKGVYYLTDE